MFYVRWILNEYDNDFSVLRKKICSYEKLNISAAIYNPCSEWAQNLETSGGQNTSSFFDILQALCTLFSWLSKKVFTEILNI